MQHTSVLLQESVSALNLSLGDTALDATCGLGGHTALMAEAVGESGRVLSFDVDREALTKAHATLSQFPQVSLIQGNFRNLHELARGAGVTEVSGILFDLGWNATQLESGRGLSFKTHDPLRMTLASHPDEGALTAEEIVNRWSEDDLYDIIHTLGEERFARRIATSIVAAREATPITFADQLAEIIVQSVPPGARKGRVHPATKTFQALRMMVNDELTSLSEALPHALELLVPGGRIAVITFHSLEDGLVKRIFKTFSGESRATLVTKKPITPSREEIRMNPRSRSAKLRIIEKL